MSAWKMATAQKQCFLVSSPDAFATNQRTPPPIRLTSLADDRYHRQYTHGISSVSGQPFTTAVSFRQAENDGSTEALCHQCNEWVVYTSRKQNAAEEPGLRVPTNWFKVGTLHFLIHRTSVMMNGYLACLHSTHINATFT